MDMPAQPGVSTRCHEVGKVLAIVGDKWTVMIVRVLVERPHRFNEIKRTVGGISQQMLARTLKALERDGMVSRTVYPTVPPQVEYALTPLGQALAVPVRALGAWAGEHLEEIENNRARYDQDKQARTKRGGSEQA
ncbi:helix-turn-helix domain-containing protein [Burkholderia cenocepacia]|uniref:winged helix-turn-helix transcriptional regulator n=1 Tax=Burkholderia cenocepacia TaxID=95486 RepID=UPI001CF122DA|nr:helix-turn-helix domain-containing protein [Burkholderia cenocepacia]MCA7964562.1 helix-turn-helix transcriptional regulator [Burkholderia cenocepacia]MDR8056110.1 helix-turn-helix transcriptional regulator [Burkholderia cenocepacia]MDR8066550.1 helix-turn-helix transcriptional regulator [Burkholderia cenocepacia]